MKMWDILVNLDSSAAETYAPKSTNCIYMYHNPAKLSLDYKGNNC